MNNFEDDFANNQELYNAIITINSATRSDLKTIVKEMKPDVQKVLVELMVQKELVAREHESWNS